jgi:hypothetical protein
MSAYLMTQNDTLILGAACRQLGLSSSIVDAARSLRKANNQALKSRYGDKPVYLRLLSMSVVNAQIDASVLSTRELIGLAERFHYQCAEGDCDPREGYQLIVTLVGALGGAL